MTEFPESNRWASVVAKICVICALALILVGAIVTTSGAGMAAPSAPYVDGTLINPDSPVTHTVWYQDPALLKEHGHRLIAMLLGLSVGVLAAMVWRNWPAFFIAVGLMFAAEGLRGHVDKNWLPHLRIWPAMIVFVALLLNGARKRGLKPGFVEWLALIAYVATCFQALLGTLRVNLETAGNIELATGIRMFHGVFAQAFLALLVILAARLSPVWKELKSQQSSEFAPKVRRMAISLLGLYLVQLALAAYIRHSGDQGLGLVIPTWPAAQPNGSWLPANWSHAIGVHFLHSRIMPILILGHVLGLASFLARRAPSPRLSRIGWLILGLVAVQIFLGVFTVLGVRGKIGPRQNPHITNTHVINGAFICAASALLIARSRALMPARA